MAILNALRGLVSNPTRDWPVVEAHLPALDTRSARLGELGFGDDVQAARFLGRPDAFLYRARDLYDLVYHRAGFVLEFDKGRLGFVAIQVHKDNILDDIEGCTEARIDDLRLDAGTTRAQVEAALGAPERDDVDSDEIVCWYARGALQLEFEYFVDGRLKRINVYPPLPDARS